MRIYEEIRDLITKPQQFGLRGRCHCDAITVEIGNQNNRVVKLFELTCMEEEQRGPDELVNKQKFCIAFIDIIIRKVFPLSIGKLEVIFIVKQDYAQKLQKLIKDLKNQLTKIWRPIFNEVPEIEIKVLPCEGC